MANTVRLMSVFSVFVGLQSGFFDDQFANHPDSFIGVCVESFPNQLYSPTRCHIHRKSIGADSLIGIPSGLRPAGLTAAGTGCYPSSNSRLVFTDLASCAAA